MKHNRASAYHAQSQGARERFHQTLKSLLRAYCTAIGGDWEEGLPWFMLFAREVVQESTRFSPNQLVFGHTVRGPLTVLWGELIEVDPSKNLIDCVNEFRHRLVTAVEMARENLESAQIRQKRLYDHQAEGRQFSPGDQVLVLTPVIGSPLQAEYTGPYVVDRQVSEQNYYMLLQHGGNILTFATLIC